jgi:hypothetical protein
MVWRMRGRLRIWQRAVGRWQRKGRGGPEAGTRGNFFTKSFSLLFEQDTPVFFLRSFGETEPPNFVPLRIQPVRSIT